MYTWYDIIKVTMVWDFDYLVKLLDIHSLLRQITYVCFSSELLLMFTFTRENNRKGKQ